MPSQQTAKQYFTILTIIHSALLTAQTAFAAITYVLISGGSFTTNPELKSVFQIAAAVVVGGGLFGSYYVGRNQLASLKLKNSLSEKLNGYRMTLILKWALLEMPSLFSLVCFLLTGSFFFLVLSAVIIVLFFLNRPSISTTVMDLELSAADRSLLENPNTTI